MPQTALSPPPLDLGSAFRALVEALPNEAVSAVLPIEV